MKKKIIIISITILLVLLSIVLYSHYIGTKGLIVKEYKIINERIPEEFHGFKIVHFSDLHYPTITEKELKNIVDKINYLRPDIVVFTGDFIENEIEDQKLDALIKNLKNIKATFKKYAISGNHDTDNIFNKIAKESDFINLNNQYDLIYNNSLEPILIAGSSSNLKTNINISEKLKTTIDYINNHDVAYRILLLHEPDYIDEIENDKFHLALAGHSHGGQIRLPFLGSIMKFDGAKKYSDFTYNINNLQLFVNSGIGTTKLKFRLNNKPSINLYRLANR